VMYPRGRWAMTLFHCLYLVSCNCTCVIDVGSVGGFSHLPLDVYLNWQRSQLSRFHHIKYSYVCYCTAHKVYINGSQQCEHTASTLNLVIRHTVYMM
jgi:hypothetical protein